jgi:hypothetical protein
VSKSIKNVQFNCPAHFPNDVPVPYVVQWEKKGRRKKLGSKGRLRVVFEG